MNLIFRMLRVLGRVLRGYPRLGLLDASSLSMRVWPTDLDLNVHLNNGRYLSIMDIGRLELIVRVGLLGALIKHGIRPVVGSVQIVYRKPLSPFQRFTLITEVVGWDDKWTYMRQRFETVDGALCAEAVLRTLFIGRGGRVSSADMLALLPGVTVQSPDISRLAGQFERAAWRPALNDG